MSLVLLHHDRAVEPCHPCARHAPCAERPLPFDIYLRQRNREADTFEPSEHRRDAANRCDPCAQPDELADRRPIKIPEVPHTETTRSAHFVYEIPSDAATGRLIDMLL